MSLVRQCNKFSALLVLFLVLPLSLEMEYVITLWLKDPPPCVVPLAICACGVTVLNKLTCGHEVAINASGKIARMHMWLLVWYLGVAVLSWLAFTRGGGIVWTGITSIIMMGCISVTRVLIARRNLGTHWSGWLCRVVMPLALVTLFSFCIGWGMKTLFSASIFRVVIVSFVTTFALCVLSWACVLSQDEREFVKARLMSRVKRFFQG